MSNNSSQPSWRNILNYGLIGSVITLYLAVIGMVEAFASRYLIGTYISMGQIFFITGAIVSGILAARAFRDKSTLSAVGASLAAGMISSLTSLLLVLFIQVFVIPQAGKDVLFNVRNMFVNFSPGLVEILTFGLGPALGSLALVIISGGLGMIGSVFMLLPSRWRNALISGVAWTLGIGIFSENVAQIVQEIIGRGLVRILFQNKSLNPTAAVVIFVVAFLVGYFRVHRQAGNQWGKLSPAQQKQGRFIGIVLLIAFILALPWMIGLFLSQALFIVGYFIMMGLGLNIVVGYAGLLDLGYVAFFAFGAYTMGVLTSQGPLGVSNANFWIALPISVLVGVIWGLLLGFPVLGMRGDYLAIVTLGFGEIIRILALSDWLAPLQGGAQGVLHIPPPNLFGVQLNTPQSMYYLVVFGSLLAAFVTIRLRESRLGRQWMAMREDEDVAEAMGINLVETKLLAFAIGAAFSAAAGAIFAARLSTIFPHSFNLLISINALALIIVGGLGSIPGVIVGGLILVGLPELLREFTEYRLLMYGILLIVMMLVRPEGFLPEATRKRELHAGEENYIEPQAAASEMEG